MNSKNTKTLLITASGTATAVNVIKQLSKMDELRIITTDSNPAELLVAPTKWGTTHYQVPLATDRDAYIASLIEICKKESVDALYPIHDTELLAVLERRSDFPLTVNLPSIHSEAVANCNDKWVNFTIGRNADLPMPYTILGSAVSVKDFATHRTLIRKPRSGVGSVGVRHCQSFSELDNSTDITENVIYQAVCNGNEFTVDVVKLDDFLVAIARERIETKAGVSTKARVFSDPWLSELSDKIASVFELEGLFCFQVIGDPVAKRVQIIDVNPRCGGGTALSSAAGYPLYEIYFSHLLKLGNADAFRQDCNSQISNAKQMMVCRYYEEVVTAIYPS